MKYAALSAFSGHLQQASPHFAAVYLLLSADDYLRHEAEKLLKSALCEYEMNWEIVEGDKATPSHFIPSVNLFSGRKILLIRDAEKLGKQHTDSICKILSGKERAAIYIFASRSLKKSTSFYKQIEKFGVIFEPLAEKPWERCETLKKEALSHLALFRKKIEPDALRLLVEMSGQDRALLFQELEKLICFLGERLTVTSSDITAICTAMTSDTVFKLGDAITAGDLKTAVRIVHQLARERSDVISLLRQLRSQFHTLFEIGSMVAAGGGAIEIQGKFPYLKGRLLDQKLAAARRFGPVRAKNALYTIDETEFRIKDLAISHEIILDQMVVKL